MFDQVLSFDEEKTRANQVMILSLGLLQIISGIVLEITTVGLGSHIGGALIGEGVGDIIYAIQSMTTGNFCWNDYLSHKAISVSVSLATMGMGAYMAQGVQGTKAIKTSFELFRLTSYRVIEESARAVVVGLTSSAIDKMFENLPQEVIIRLDKRLRHQINQSFENQQLIQQIDEKIKRIFRILGPVEAKHQIQNRFAEALSNINKLGMVGKITQASFDLVQQVNSCFIMHADRCIDSAMNNQVLLAAKMVRDILPILRATPQFQIMQVVYGIIYSFQ